MHMHLYNMSRQYLVAMAKTARTSVICQAAPSSPDTVCPEGVDIGIVPEEGWSTRLLQMAPGLNHTCLGEVW